MNCIVRAGFAEKWPRFWRWNTYIIWSIICIQWCHIIIGPRWRDDWIHISTRLASCQ
jgi:hypothetical protein